MKAYHYLRLKHPHDIIANIDAYLGGLAEMKAWRPKSTGEKCGG